MKRFTLLTTFALTLSVCVCAVGCGNSDKISTDLVESEDVLKEDSIENNIINSDDGIISESSESKEEYEVIEHSVKPVSAKVYVNPNSAFYSDEIEYKGEYEFFDDGSYCLTVDNNYKYFFSGTGLLTKYERWTDSSENPVDYVYTEQYFVNGIGIRGGRLEEDNRYSTFSNVFYFDDDVMDDLYHFQFEYDNKGNILGDVISRPSGYNDKFDYVLIERDDKNRITKTVRLESIPYGYTIDDVVKKDGTFDLSIYGDDDLVGSFYEYDDENNTMSVTTEAFYPNKDEDTPNHPDIIVQYNDDGLPVSVDLNSLFVPDEENDYKWHLEYDNYGYLSQVYFSPSYSYPTLRIVNNYSDDGNQDKTEDTSISNDEINTGDSQEYIDYVAKKVKEAKGFDIREYDCRIDDSDDTYYIEVYKPIEDSDGVYHHICDIAIKKDYSEILYADDQYEDGHIEDMWKYKPLE